MNCLGLPGTAAVLAGLLTLAGQDPAKRPLPTWMPSKPLLAQLAPEEAMPGFRLRPPKGYTLQRQEQGPGQRFAWVGPVRRDGTRPHLMAVLLTPPPGDEKKYTAEQALDRFLAAIQGRRQEWRRTASEQGLVNGRVFVRAHWSGVEPSTQRQVRGFSYVAMDGRKIVELSSQDVAPHDKEALKLAEAAALTFRRQ
jgi:hypothetical protein